jgi:Domain of unknown function (DUF4062)
MEKRFQVFVSSTYEDLITERETLSMAVLRSHNIPSGMELSSGANERTLDVIYRWIDDSDFFLLLLGGRYGSLDATTGLSYTELEYNYAKEHGKPVIVLWLTDEYIDKKVSRGSISIRVAYERTNIDKWNDFKRRVTEGSFCIPISDPSELEAKVFAALDSVKMSYSLGGWVRSSDVLEDVLDQYAKYVNCYLDILASDKYTRREIEDLLRILQAVTKNFVCQDIGWLDVMIPVKPTEEDRPSLLLQCAGTGDIWLKVLYSGIRRTNKPTLIPTSVNRKAWRGSGNAFLSDGIDYVGSFQGRYSGREYNLPRGLARQMETQYAYWRQEHYFASLLAIAILAPESGSVRAVGVLNFNFKRENPFGNNDTLSPQQSDAILNVLEPALQLLTKAILRYNSEAGDEK